jgi:hypothetical protein
MSRREFAVSRFDLDALITSGNPSSSPAASRAWGRLLDAVHASAEVAIVVTGEADAEKGHGE